jgi:hypothetical protein
MFVFRGGQFTLHRRGRENPAIATSMTASRLRMLGCQTLLLASIAYLRWNKNEDFEILFEYSCLMMYFPTSPPYLTN